MPAKKKGRSLRCPTCRHGVVAGAPELPFCSERCRLIDLGKWASNGYVISTRINDPEELIDAEAKEERIRHGDEEKGPGRPN